MSFNKSEKHNQLAQEFVQKVGRETDTMPELMVVTESLILSSMLMLIRVHGFAPSAASMIMESALQRATERLAVIEK